MGRHYPEWLGTFGAFGGTRHELSTCDNPCLAIPYPYPDAVMVRERTAEDAYMRHPRRPAHVHVIHPAASSACAGRRTPGHETAEPRPGPVAVVPISANGYVSVAGGQAPEQRPNAADPGPVDGTGDAMGWHVDTDGRHCLRAR